MANAPSIKAVMLLDADGARIVAKFYSPEWSTLQSQVNIERQLFQKTKNARSEVEVVLFDKVMAVFKRSGDVLLYVIGSPEENELILASVLTCLEESLLTLFQSEANGQIEKRTMIDNLDMLLLTVDEIVDEGIIFENDSQQVAQRVAQRGPDMETPLGEQTFSQALETAKNQFIRSLQNV